MLSARYWSSVALARLLNGVASTQRQACGNGSGTPCPCRLRVDDELLVVADGRPAAETARHHAFGVEHEGGAIERPSQIPPAIADGRDQRISTIEDTSRGSGHRPHCPRRLFCRRPRLPSTDRHDVEDRHPGVVRVGETVRSPADVVTNRTPWSCTKSTIPGSRTKSCAMFTPNGLSVRSRILAISSRTWSS